MFRLLFQTPRFYNSIDVRTGQICPPPIRKSLRHRRMLTLECY